MPAQQKTPCLQRVSNYVIHGMEGVFGRLGHSVGTRPWLYIVGSLLFATVCNLGFLKFERETRPERLWVPVTSPFYNNSIWLVENFPGPVRYQFGILTAEDVLTPQAVMELLKMHDRIENVTVYGGKTWQDICFRLPVMKMEGAQNMMKGVSHMRRYRRSLDAYNASSTEDDKMLHVNTDDYLDDFDELDDFDAQMAQGMDQIHNPIINTHPPTQTTSRQQRIDGTTESAIPLVVVDDIEKAFEIDHDFYNGTMLDNGQAGGDPSVHFPKRMYCAVVDSIPQACWEQSLLELWEYSHEKISKLTKQDIVNAVNTVNISPVFGTPANYSILLGTPTVNASGHVIAAKAIMTRWYTSVNYSELATMDGVEGMMDTGLSDPADRATLEWELGFIDAINDYDYPEGIEGFVRAWRSFADVGGSSIMADMNILFLGALAVLIYVFIMIGDFNWVEQRPLSSCMGLLCNCMAISVSYGICSILGVPYGPVHNALPFLMVGLGIDDMFVIVQCWRNLNGPDRLLPLPERMALTMKHAGVSISVTSITDVIAFGIGATTILPALRSFCLYAALGMVSVYILQLTFFAAWFVIEQRRIEEGRNPLLCCHVKDGYEPSKVTSDSRLQKSFAFIAKCILSKPGKIIVIVVSLAMLAVNGWGMSFLKQKFDPIWFLSPRSYLFKYAEALYSNFPADGEEGFLFVINTNYSIDMPAFEHLMTEMRNSDAILELEEWYFDFKEFVNKYYAENVPDRPLSESQFRDYLSTFLFSPSGARHQKNFEFADELQCTKPAPNVYLTRIPFRFRLFSGPEEHIPAMQDIRRIVSDTHFRQPGAWSFTWAYTYCLWETDEVISEEMFRNMALAMICVFLTTLILIANVSTSIMVLLCVCFTLVDVMGGMAFWGMTIETVSCISLVLAIGLCVDYAAHIGHTYMTLKGERSDRVHRTLRDIGPAVLHGALSTLLAVGFVSFSESHVFQTFFKVFLMIILYGAYHGLIVLPVMLSLFGPPPYVTSTDHDAPEIDTEKKWQLVSTDDVVSGTPLKESGMKSSDVAKASPSETEPLKVTITSFETSEVKKLSR